MAMCIEKKKKNDNFIQKIEEELEVPTACLNRKWEMGLENYDWEVHLLNRTCGCGGHEKKEGMTIFKSLNETVYPHGVCWRCGHRLETSMLRNYSS